MANLKAHEQPSPKEDITEPAPQLSLEQLTDEFQNFAYIISHDLNTPLRSIISFSKLLSEKYSSVLDEKGQIYLSMIIESGKKAQDMLEGLLYYARLKQTNNSLEQDIDPKFLIEKSCSLLGESAVKADIVIEGKLPEITGNRNQLEKLFFCLLENALKFSMPNIQPKIQISAHDFPEYWQFAVIDNGIGIEPNLREKAFMIFRKFHHDGAYPGQGLGLAFAKRIIELHQGKIWIDAAPNGNGTAVYFTLPKTAKV